MKRWLVGIGGMAGMLFLALLVMIRRKGAMAVSIIGGADGPTSVFLAGKVGNQAFLALLCVWALIMGALGWFFWKSKQKH